MTKANDLNKVLGDIEKNFGKGAIMRLGDASGMKVETFPTGSLTLDLALGGGLPKGRIVEIYGPESSGKCLSANAYVLSQYGLLTINELFRHEGYNPSCTTRVIEHEVGLINENKRIEKTSHLTWNYRRPIKRVITRSGIQLEMTQNHRVRVMSKNGNIVWRQGLEIQPGDRVVIIRDTQHFGANDLTTDEAEFIGYLIADGSMGGTNKIQFSNNDLDIIDNFSRITASLVDTKIKSYPQKGSNGIDHHINNKTFRELCFEKYGLDYVKAAEKSVPYCVRTGSREIQIAFLQAYFELDCYVDSRKRIIVATSASHRLLSQIQLMLLNLGFLSRMKTKFVNGTDYYDLSISALDYDRYGELIGFRSQARWNVYKSAPSRTQVQTNIDSIPYLGRLLEDLYRCCDTDRAGSSLLGDYIGDNPKSDVTYDRLERIINYFSEDDRSLSNQGKYLLNHLVYLYNSRHFYDEVDYIEDDEMPTFDVVMPETHTFWSNGMSSHNTTIALHAIAEVQKAGGSVCFVDAEHALDPIYATALGVDINELFVSQCDTGEIGLEIVDQLVKSGSMDLIVVDSVAALVPRAEIEGDMGDSHPGLQARLMSQALRKITGSIGKTHCTVIFLNQLRQKIGISYGNPEVTTGGNALKFYASVRLDVRRIQTLKKGTEEYGIRAKVKVAKNKVAPPFRIAEFDILFGKGISTLGCIIDLAETQGIIVRKGAWYSYEGGNVGQGRENTIEWLKLNPAIAATIEAQIKSATIVKVDAPVVVEEEVA